MRVWRSCKTSGCAGGGVASLSPMEQGGGAERVCPSLLRLVRACSRGRPWARWATGPYFPRLWAALGSLLPPPASPPVCGSPLARSKEGRGGPARCLPACWCRVASSKGGGRGRAPPRCPPVSWRRPRCVFGPFLQPWPRTARTCVVVVVATAEARRRAGVVFPRHPPLPNPCTRRRRRRRSRRGRKARASVAGGRTHTHTHRVTRQWTRQAGGMDGERERSAGASRGPPPGESSSAWRARGE